MTDEARDLRWTDEGDGRWTTTGSNDTFWEIDRKGDSFAITIAHWDRPDWWANSLEEAKLLVSEVDARPPIPESERKTEPFVPGSATVAYATSNVPPAGSCACGSATPPEAVKPAHATSDWWEDPAAYWRCPACEAGRGYVDY